jgi:hypothetical protein
MKSDYDTETLEDYEARPRGRTASAIRHARLHNEHKRERWRRVADGSQPAVISRDSYAYCPHSRERENARRLRQRQNA